MQLVNALNECGQNELPRAKSNCLQLPPTAYCSHSKVSPSLTCLSRFFYTSSLLLSLPLLLLHSSLPLSICFLLAAKSSWNFIRNLRLQIFLLLFSLLLLFLRLFAWAVVSPPPFSLLAPSVRPLVTFLLCLFVCHAICAIWNMADMIYGICQA